jgi:hypothetical protein
MGGGELYTPGKRISMKNKDGEDNVAAGIAIGAILGGICLGVLALSQTPIAMAGSGILALICIPVIGVIVGAILGGFFGGIIMSKRY